MSRLALPLCVLFLASPAMAGILKEGTVPTDVSRPAAPLTRGFTAPPAPPPPAPRAEPSAGS
jgi:hypothetical protein